MGWLYLPQSFIKTFFARRVVASRPLATGSA